MTNTQTVALTGATGFVGREIVRQLLATGRLVRALVRSREKARDVLPPSPALELVTGDVFDTRIPAELVRGTDACIHLIGIIREERGGPTFAKAHPGATGRMVEACKALEVRRFVQMSALGSSAEGRCAYQRTKWDAEQLVRRSGLDWTIFRPGLIHGADSMIAELASGWVSGQQAPWLFMPYFTRVRNDTSVLLGRDVFEDPAVAPVHVSDVAQAFVAALNTPDSIGETYNLAGSEVLTWPNLLRVFRDNLPSGNPSMHPWGVPGMVASGVATVAGALGLGGILPFDTGMAVMGACDSVAGVDKARLDLGFRARGFTETLKEYARSVA